jgi:glucan 1,3-beta-glucosidase
MWKLVALLLALAIQVHAFRAGAPPSRVNPLPLSQFRGPPPKPQNGHFVNRNESVHPAKPVQPAHSSPPPKPGSCDVEHPSPQKTFWLEGVPHEGTSPFLVRGHGYQVFRNVKSFGAKGDGVTDDTAAFTAALTSMQLFPSHLQYIGNSYSTGGGRCSAGACGTGSTGQPALIYVPAGKYLVSSPIQLFVGTQVVGDAINLPSIVASSAFTGESVVAGFDPGTGSTTNFFIGLRNVILDSTSVASNSTVSLLNWAVSQGTNLINVHFDMPVNSQHTGIIMDGGSGGGGSGTFLGDLTFNGGLIGIHLNNQQYAFKNCKFINVATGIAVQHLFVGSFQGMSFEGCGIGVDLGGIGMRARSHIFSLLLTGSYQMMSPDRWHSSTAQRTMSAS